MKQIKRGEIYYADLSPIVGSEQGGLRPVLVLQNDMETDIVPPPSWRPLPAGKPNPTCPLM